MNRFSTPVLLLGWLFLIIGQSVAQTTPADVLYKLDHSPVKAKISDVTTTDVFYAELTTPGTTRKISKANLWKVVFADGSTDVFNAPGGSGSAPAKPVPMVRTESAPAATRPGVRPETTLRRETTGSQPTYQNGSAKSIIKYAPLSSFGYEHVLPNNRSIYGGISLYSLGFGVSALGIKGEYRFYGLINSSPKQAPEGFWVAPTVLLWRVSSNDFYGETESVTVAQVGGIAGYQWIFNNKISLEPALGLSLTALGSGSDSSLGAGFVPLFALRVGYVLK